MNIKRIKNGIIGGFLITALPAHGIWSLSETRWEVPLAAVTEGEALSVTLWPDRGIDCFKIRTRSRRERTELVRLLDAAAKAHLTLVLDFSLLEGPEHARRIGKEVWIERQADPTQVHVVGRRQTFSLASLMDRLQTWPSEICQVFLQF